MDRYKQITNDTPPEEVRLYKMIGCLLNGGIKGYTKETLEQAKILVMRLNANGITIRDDVFEEEFKGY